MTQSRSPNPLENRRLQGRMDDGRPSRAQVDFESGPKEYQRVFGGHTVCMGIYRCQQCSPKTGAEQVTRTHNINIPFGGLYVKHVGGRRIPIDVSHAAFFNSGEPYQTSHPAGGGDWGAYLSVRPDVLMEILTPLDPGVKDHEDRPFRANHGPLEARDLLHAHRLGAAAMNGKLGDSLETEETLLHLFASIVRVANRPRRLDGSGGPGEPADGSTKRKRSHRDLAFDARTLIARQFTETLTLDALAHAVGASPYHLCRVFKQVWGETLHGYQQRLRLREALVRLHDPATDLMTLALDLGFASHSHFSARFRREFGVAPSEVRRSFEVSTAK